MPRLDLSPDRATPPPVGTDATLAEPSPAAPPRVEAADDDTPRTVGDGRYALLDVIGDGGTATVYRARDLRLGVDRAIKLLSGTRGLATDMRRRLLAEARVMSRIAHPNILPVYDVGEDASGRAFIVMELATGGTLFDALDRGGPLPAARAARAGIEVLEALSAAHDAGVIHRDVKPANILVGADGQALLGDFGIALLGEDAARHTRADVAMGSFSYMPPEQRVDARSVGPTADVFAVGATLYALVTDTSPVDLFLAEADSPRWRFVPEPLRPVLRTATGTDPAERYPSALAFADALIAVLPALDGLAAPPRPAAPPGPPAPIHTTAPERRRPWEVLALAGFVILATIGITLATSPRPLPEATPPAGPSAVMTPPVLPAPAAPVPEPPAPLAAPASNGGPAAASPRPHPEAAPAVDAPASATVVSGAETRRWAGSFGGYVAELALSGAADALSGAVTVHNNAGTTTTPVRGAMDDAGTLHLHALGAEGAAGDYTLTLTDDDARIQGFFLHADGARRFPVQMRRAP